jgi:hypothetical protein
MRPRAGAKLVAPLASQADRRGAHQDCEHDERQHVAECAAIVADEGAEQISRHEHFDHAHRCQVWLLRASFDMLRRRAAILLHEGLPSLRRQGLARSNDVHHQQAESNRNGHVQEEQRERTACQRSELTQTLELRDARGERGEHQRDYHEEKHPQEHLAERIQHESRELPRTGEYGRRSPADQKRRSAGGGADRQAEQDAICKAGVDFRH